LPTWIVCLGLGHWRLDQGVKLNEPFSSCGNSSTVGRKPAPNRPSITLVVPAGILLSIAPALPGTPVFLAIASLRALFLILIGFFVFLLTDASPKRMASWWGRCRASRRTQFVIYRRHVVIRNDLERPALAGIHESILDVCATVRPHFVIATVSSQCRETAL
jgi:hypothetical protein